jgi:ribosomal protein S17E
VFWPVFVWSAAQSQPTQTTIMSSSNLQNLELDATYKELGHQNWFPNFYSSAQVEENIKENGCQGKVYTIFGQIFQNKLMASYFDSPLLKECCQDISNVQALQAKVGHDDTVCATFTSKGYRVIVETYSGDIKNYVIKDDLSEIYIFLNKQPKYAKLQLNDTCCLQLQTENDITQILKNDFKNNKKVVDTKRTLKSVKLIESVSGSHFTVTISTIEIQTKIDHPSETAASVQKVLTISSQTTLVITKTFYINKLNDKPEALIPI